MAQYDVLKNYLSKYKHKDLAQGDIIRTIQQYKDLRPNSAPFVFNDGSQKLLVHLDGTIPVNYKGNIYNIPIEVWILDTHPYNPPIVYVRPTSAMQIRQGRYVDANGKVDLPYITEWKYPTSDLLSLIQILTFTFGEECPVFSRSQRPPAGPTYPGSTPYPGGMPMPGVGQPYPAPTSTAGMPGMPSYPPNQTSYPPYPNAGGGPPNSYHGNTPYPPYPPTSSAQNSSFPTPYPPTTTNPQATSYPGVPTPGQPYPPTAAGYPTATTNNQFNSQTPYPATANNVGGERPPFTPGGTVSEADIRASLLSAVEDKMRRRLKETFAQAQAEMDVLSKTKNDLTAGKQKLESMVGDLEKEKNEITRNIQMLTEKDQEVKEAIQKMEENDEVNIDEAVVTTTPLYRQLLEAFAEEQAIEDAIYYLGEGLRKNVVELESFLKRVRELSRRQFILRATIQKCREKAGLPPLV